MLRRPRSSVTSHAAIDGVQPLVGRHGTGAAQHLQRPSVWAITLGIGRTEDRDSRLLQSRGQVQRTAVHTHDRHCSPRRIDQTRQARRMTASAFDARQDAGAIRRSIDYQRNPKHPSEPPRQLGVRFERPLLGSPTRQRAGQNEVATGQWLLGLASRKWERMKHAGSAGCARQVDIPFHYVAGS